MLKCRVVGGYECEGRGGGVFVCVGSGEGSNLLEGARPKEREGRRAESSMWRLLGSPRVL
jgi:hypothetical protein